MIGWLLKFISDNPDAASIDVIRQITFDSWMPVWLVPFILAALAGLVIWQYRRARSVTPFQRWLMTGLRIGAYAAALFMISRPTLEVDAEGLMPGPVPVILDATESMQIGDTGSQPRYQAAHRLVAEIIARQKMYPDLELHPYLAGEAVVPLDTTLPPAMPTEGRTSINKMLSGGMNYHLGSYSPGVILVSDGAHNAPELVEQIGRQLEREGLPVYAVGVGQERSRDLAIPFVLAEDVVFVNEKAKLYANVTQRGYAGRQIKVRVLLNDRVVATEEVSLTDETEQSVPIEYIPEKEGEYLLRVEVVPQTDEITADNNLYVKNLRVIDEKIRILLVFGSPTWEYRYLRGTLDRDKRVNYKAYLQDIDPRILDRKADIHSLQKLPEDAKALHDEYDLVFISAINVALLPKEFQEGLAGFVRDNAGGLVVVSDRTYVPYTMKESPLEPLVPVTLGEGIGESFRDELFAPKRIPLKFSLTDEGKSNPLVAFSGNPIENAI